MWYLYGVLISFVAYYFTKLILGEEGSALEHIFVFTWPIGMPLFWYLTWKGVLPNGRR